MKPPYYKDILSFLNSFQPDDFYLIMEFKRLLLKRPSNVIYKSRAVGYSYFALFDEIYCFYKKHPYRNFIKDWNNFEKRFKKLKAFS